MPRNSSAAIGLAEILPKLEVVHGFGKHLSSRLHNLHCTQPCKHHALAAITLQKGEETTRKKSKISSYFAFQDQLPATPCSGPQLLVEECRLGGYSPRFRKRRRGPRKFFRSWKSQCSHCIKVALFRGIAQNNCYELVHLYLLHVVPPGRVPLRGVNPETRMP